MLKKIAIVVAVIVTCVSLGALACGGSMHRPSKEERLSRMQQHLNLSEDQVSQIRGIHENGGGREEVAAVLTEDQRQQMHNFRKNRQHRYSQKAEEPEE